MQSDDDDRISELDAVAKHRDWLPPLAPEPVPGTKLAADAPSKSIADIIRTAAELRGVAISPASGGYFCGGRFVDDPKTGGVRNQACETHVEERGGFCGACGDFNSRKLRRQLLRSARESLPADHRFGSELFRKVVAVEPQRAAIARGAEAWRSMAADGKPTNLVLLGSSGVGKTFVAVAVANRILDAAEEPTLAMQMFERARGMRWMKVRDILAAARGHRFGSGDAPAVVAAKRAPILVLDEFGFEQRPREGEPDLLFEILDARYTSRLTTILTSGKTVGGITRRYGEAIKRRITDRATIVEAFRENDPEVAADRAAGVRAA